MTALLLEFSPVFYITDHVYQTNQHFKGNFTLEVIGGGVGYVENIKHFSEEEIALYNFREGTE